MTISVAQTPARRRTAWLRRADPAQLRLLLALVRQRRALRDLDDHLLRDIGVSRSEAAQEADRPLWDVPANWRK